MPAQKRFRPQPDNRFAFFTGFLQKPMEVGSIIPSSRFLERRIVSCADVGRAKTVVELGPGTGGTTRALLRAMDPGARLLALEINQKFVDLLRESRDPRLIVHHGGAAEIVQALEENNLPKPDVVLSGIPFSTIPRQAGIGIVKSVYDSLDPGGLFVAYQVRDRVESLGREVFGEPRIQKELLNVPPMRVYRWEKR